MLEDPPDVVLGWGRGHAQAGSGSVIGVEPQPPLPNPLPRGEREQEPADKTFHALENKRHSTRWKTKDVPRVGRQKTFHALEDKTRRHDVSRVTGAKNAAA